MQRGHVARDVERLLAIRAIFVVALAKAWLELLLRDVPEARLRIGRAEIGIEREAIIAHDQIGESADRSFRHR